MSRRKLTQRRLPMPSENIKIRYTLYIGTKNFSSWSLRPWLAMKMAQTEFSEIVIPLRQPGTREAIRQHSPSGKVPLLVMEHQSGRELVWDSLAICETLAERFPAAQLWPAGAAARAQARSAVAEMHSGFADLRAALPMDITARNKTPHLDEVVREQIGRVLAIWQSALSQFGGPDGFLFGQFSIADAFYAPVVTRFLTHGIDIPALQQSYARRMLDLPAMQQWASEARAERATMN
jgi:glutathione S-transferase